MYWPWRWRTAPSAYKVHTKSPRNQSPSTLQQSQKIQGRDKIISPLNSSPRKKILSIKRLAMEKVKLILTSLEDSWTESKWSFHLADEWKEDTDDGSDEAASALAVEGPNHLETRVPIVEKRTPIFLSLSIFSLLAKENGVFCAGVDLENPMGHGSYNCGPTTKY